MEIQKSFKHNGATYLLVALQFIDNVVIRVSKEGVFLFDCDMSNETYKDGLATNINLVQESFSILENEIITKN